MIPCYLQSIHIVDVQCHNKVVNKPTVITDYNKNMGAVDIVDQYFGDYSIAWKRRKKYYKKMFFHLLDKNTLNSYFLYKKHGGKYFYSMLCLSLVDELIETYLSSDNIPRRGRQTWKITPYQFDWKAFSWTDTSNW